PIYASDAIVRRASALQMTADARPPVVGVPSELAAERGIVDGTMVRVSHGAGSVLLPARIDPSLASSVLRVPAAHPLTAALGPMFGRLDLTVEPVAQDAGAIAASTV
ncbi:MAG TPA: molybdopterin dinucleotide binding domain-containing protein, partial [Burkholderiaceae bacterium]|nr:molybdopterin dinucleotide binding domain-containing protein [Burkholderiaceae bacterium]